MDIRKTLFISLLALTISACSKSDEGPTPPPPTGDMPMVVAATPASRAASPLEQTYVDFGIFAWKTAEDNSTQRVICRDDYSAYLTMWSGTKWYYDLTDGSVTQTIRYWDPNARDYTFVGYAPYSMGGTDLEDIYNITATPAGLSISGVTGNNPISAASPDWLEARYRRVNAEPIEDYDLLSATPTTNIAPGAELASTVPLVFHHIMSVVEFRIYNAVETPANISSITIELSDGSTLVTTANYNKGSWQNLSNPTSTLVDYSATTIIAGGPERKDATTAAQLIEIPQSMVGKEVTITITVDGEAAPLTGTFTFGDTWLGENRYIYFLRISTDHEIILADVEVEPLAWQQGEDVDVDDPVVNW